MKTFICNECDSTHTTFSGAANCHYGIGGVAESLPAASDLLARWIAGTATFAEERDLYDNGEISECDYEFGPHDHDDAECERIMADMNPTFPDDQFNTVDEFGITSWED